MSYTTERFPRKIAAGFSGGPAWQTTIVHLDNGREQRNSDWLYPKHQYSANLGAFDPDTREELLEFFHAMRGRFHAFRFSDRRDYSVTDQVIAPAGGTSTPVQLIKTYTKGGVTSTRLIQAPVAGTVTVYRNGVAVAGTLAADTGLFTPDVAWAATGTFTWTGEFDVWVRFDNDFASFTSVTLDVWMADLELIEVRR